MAETGYSTIDRDCSLDLHEAIQLLELLFNTFENAGFADDWWRMRQPIGSGILAAQNHLYRALRRVEGAPAVRRDPTATPH